jgi:hypothetical protein
VARTTKHRRDTSSESPYDRAIRQLAKVLAGWISEDGRALDEYLTQVAEDLEELVAKEIES